MMIIIITIIIIIIIIIYQLKRCNPTFELGNPDYSNNNESIFSLQQMYISLTLFLPHPLQNQYLIFQGISLPISCTTHPLLIFASPLSYTSPSISQLSLHQTSHPFSATNRHAKICGTFFVSQIYHLPTMSIVPFFTSVDTQAVSQSSHTLVFRHILIKNLKPIPMYYLQNIFFHQHKYSLPPILYLQTHHQT